MSAQSETMARKKGHLDEDRERIQKLRARLIDPESDHTRIALETADRQSLEHIAADGVERLLRLHRSGFGVFPSAHPDDIYFNQVWTRDVSHAGGNYYAMRYPQALRDSLQTILSHQREDGALPLKVEREYGDIKVIPGLRRLAKPVFNLIWGDKERPEFEGQNFSGAEDTVPAVIISIGEYLINSVDGLRFFEEHYGTLKKALRYFENKVDPADGLAVCRRKNPDWADSIRRGGGKLGTINVSWARALRIISFMASRLGKQDEADLYRAKFQRVKASIIEKLYDHEGAYMRSSEGEDRVDAVTSIFGSLFLLNPVECARVQETLKNRLRHASGLANFDPPYPRNKILFAARVIGRAGQHNEYVWPWVTCQNIQVKIKIAREHPNSEIREQYKNEAVDDLLDMAKLFEGAGGAYETFESDSRKPAISALYKMPQNLMANLAAYEGAYDQMKALGWI